MKIAFAWAIPCPDLTPELLTGLTDIFPFQISHVTPKPSFEQTYELTC